MQKILSKYIIQIVCLILGLYACSVEAQAITAVCLDGSASFSANNTGTCSRHGGVAYWVNQNPSNISRMTNEGVYEYHKVQHAAIIPRLNLSTANTNVIPQIKPLLLLDNSRSLNAQGIQFTQQGNIEQALLAFEQAAQLNPNDGEVLGNLAYSHYQLRHYEPSEQVLYRALTIKPKRGASWILMGQLRSVRGDLNGAVEALDKYLYFSSRKNAAVEQLSGWANGYGDGANIPVLRQAAAQSLANAGY